MRFSDSTARTNVQRDESQRLKAPAQSSHQRDAGEESSQAVAGDHCACFHSWMGGPVSVVCALCLPFILSHEGAFQTLALRSSVDVAWGRSAGLEVDACGRGQG